MYWRNSYTNIYGRPKRGARIFLAAVVIAAAAAAAAVVAAAIAAAVIAVAAAAEEQNQNDDPPAAVIPVRHTHNHYLRNFFERFAAHSMVFRQTKKVRRKPR